MKQAWRNKIHVEDKDIFYLLSGPCNDFLSLWTCIGMMSMFFFHQSFWEINVCFVLLVAQLSKVLIGEHRSLSWSGPIQFCPI